MFFIYNAFSLMLCIQISFFVIFILKKEQRRFLLYSKSWFVYTILLLILSLVLGLLVWFVLSFFYEVFSVWNDFSIQNIYIITSFPIASFILTYLLIGRMRRLVDKY